MPKHLVKFGPKIQRDFPFLKEGPGSQSDVICTLCKGKFNIGNGGRNEIGRHLNTQKHIKATKALNSSEPMTFLQKLEECAERKPEFQSSIHQPSGSSETNEPVDFQVEDLVHNCRFCFEPFTDNRKSIEITETIEKQFFELTQCRLIRDDAFSKVICISCENELGVSFNYRNNLLLNQRKLYEAQLQRDVPDVKQEFDSVIIKTEMPDDFMTEEVLQPESPACELEEESSKPVRGPYKKKTMKTPELNEEDQKFMHNKIKVLQRSKETRVNCPQCFKQMHKSSVREHFFAVHARKTKFKCDLCSQEFYRRSRLLWHIETHHLKIRPKVETNIEKTPCELCGALVNDQKKHRLKVHFRVKNFFCDLCPFGFFQKYELEKHMLRHLKRKPDKYFCEVCGQEFDQRAKLTTHIRKRHTVREKKHQCKVCLKFFLTPSILAKHAEHHSARDLPCEFCGKLFTCKNNLRTHLYYHAPPKFVCDFPNCDKKYHLKKLFRGHMKSHRGEKDFECEMCNRGFFSQSDLNRHTTSVHKKLRFFCSLPGCNGDFTRRSYYKKHVLAVHQNLAQDDLERLLENVRVAEPSQK